MFINYHQHRIIKEINPYLDYHPKDCVNEIEFGKTKLKGEGSNNVYCQYRTTNLYRGKDKR